MKRTRMPLDYERLIHHYVHGRHVVTYWWEDAPDVEPVTVSSRSQGWANDKAVLHYTVKVALTRLRSAVLS